MSLLALASVAEASARERALRRKRLLLLAGALLLLAAIILPGYRQGQHERAAKEARQLLQGLHRAETRYREVHGTFAGLDTLRAAGSSPVGERGRYRGYAYTSSAGTEEYTVSARPLWPEGTPYTIDAGGILNRPRPQKRLTLEQQPTQARVNTRESPHSAPEWLQLSRRLSQRGQREGALNAARQAARLDRQAAADTLYDALANRAEELTTGGKATEALILAREARALDPGDPEAQALAGDAYRALGRKDAAERAYRQAIAIGAASARAWYGLAQLQESRGEKDAAARSSLRVIDIGADDYAPEAWIDASWAALQRLRPSKR